MKRILKKVRLNICVFLAAVLGFTMTAAVPAAACDTTSSVQDYRAAYTAFARKQQKKTGDTLYMKILNSGQSVLLLTDSGSVYKDQGINAVAAKVYRYSDGKVKFVASLRSTGTAYPLCRKGNYLLAGFHHSSMRLKITDAAVTAEQLNGLYTGKKYCRYEKWNLKGKNSRLVKSVKVPAKKAESIDYYTNRSGDYAGKVISFQKVA